ncbi:amidase domain-containing protein [Streptomyces sp. V1I6]|uniref:amidase domain-containing protein n=1 Tax=Streptomyces sp. V1I6 TaxID=3042273 RepID=UPI003594009F
MASQGGGAQAYAGAENWYWYASRHSKRTKLQNNVWKLAYTDLLQADWNRDNTIDHTMIVTATGRNECYLTHHTSSTHNRKLSSLLAARPAPGGTCIAVDGRSR